MAGADVHAADQDGNTALHIAARYGHELLINTLLQHDADILKCLISYSLSDVSAIVVVLCGCLIQHVVSYFCVVVGMICALGTNVCIFLG